MFSEPRRRIHLRHDRVLFTVDVRAPSALPVTAAAAAAVSHAEKNSICLIHYFLRWSLILFASPPARSKEPVCHSLYTYYCLRTFIRRLDCPSVSACLAYKPIAWKLVAVPPQATICQRYEHLYTCGR